MSDTNWGQAVTGIVIENNKVLLVRHTYGGAKNMLVVPGGYVNIGETPQDALKREILEETNIIVEPNEIIGIRFNMHDWYVAFRAKYISGKAKSDNSENSEVIWLDIDEVLKKDDISDLTKKLIVCALNKECGLEKIEYEGNMKNGIYSFYGMR